MSVKTVSQLDHLKLRRNQLVNHIEFLYIAKRSSDSELTQKSIMTQKLQAEAEIDLTEKYMISLGWNR